MAELARLELPNHLSIKWCRKCCSRIILLNVLDFFGLNFQNRKVMLLQLLPRMHDCFQPRSKK